MAKPPSDNDSRDSFSAAVSQAAGLPESAKHDPAERRRMLLEYREKVEKARLEQATRLAKLAEAQRKLDAELAELERQEAERVELERKEEARKKVEEIKAHSGDPVPAPKAPGKAAAPEAQRRSPRFDIHAAVRFGTPPDDLIMRARNISMTGALLATEPGVAGKYPIGSVHEVTVFVSAEPKKGIALHAKVVRHETSSIAVDWSSDVEASFRVALMISSLEPE